MKITVDESTNLARVVVPAFGAQDVYLDTAVVDSLKKSGIFDKMENMNLTVNFPHERWEILDEPPVGTPGTIASVIFHIEGFFTKNDTRITCALDT